MFHVSHRVIELYIIHSVSLAYPVTLEASQCHLSKLPGSASEILFVEVHSYVIC